MSDETKQIFLERDAAWHNYTQNPNPDNFRGYKHLKSRAKNALKKDKQDRDRETVAGAADSRNLWKEAKISNRLD